MKIRLICSSCFAAVIGAWLLGCHKSSPKLTEERREGPITIDPNVHVSEAYATVPHPETILAADSSDSGYLLAGAMTDDEPGHKSSVVGYFSRDGGKTWKLALKRTATTGREATEFYDPTVAFGPDGVAHFAVLRRSASKQQIEMALSRDRGQTWEKPITLPQTGADRPFIGSDNLRGRIYCDCTLSASRSRSVAVFTSRDGGKNFDPPKTLAVANPGPGLFPGPMAVLSDGLIVVPYSLRLVTGKEPLFAFRIRRSSDGAESFSDEQTVIVRNYLGENTNAGRFAVLAVDRGSKAFSDRLYLTWTEKTPDGLHVMLALSSDKGLTWSAPVQLSEQREFKQGPSSKSYHALLPAIAVNNSGIVGVTWYDTRASAPGKPACNLRFRASLDGGSSWLQSVQVSDVASTFELNDKDGGVTPESF